MRTSMKISFYQNQTIEAEKKTTENTHNAAARIVKTAVPGACYAGSSQEWFGGQQSEKGKSLLDIRQEAANTNVEVQQDYMTLMSNTMSEKDYAKLQEDGFDFGSLSPEEAVTIVDRIKAELVRSGKQIAGYTDDLDLDTLTAAVGSQVLAQSLQESFARADIPFTEENVQAVCEAWNMAKELQPLQDGSLQYLIDNQMDGEIWNLYLAQSSGAASRQTGNVPGFFAEEVSGYYTRSASGEWSEELSAQIDRVLEQSGRELTEENRKEAAWLLEKGLPLTEENLDRLEDLQALKLPVKETDFANGAAEALSEGKNPVHASISGKEETIYEKAERLVDYYNSAEAWEKTAGNLTARRQLEEVRLKMTAEVNVKLLKSGFSIDTTPMEELVEALKTAEEELAQNYFPGDAQAVEKYSIYSKMGQAAAEIPYFPVSVLGTFLEQEEPVSFDTFYETGAALRESYEKAGESYETLMTAPRRDFGDSIQKAFGNIDEVLQEAGLEVTEENRRAARILGYNRMEITPENVERVLQADEQVKSVVEKLTPGATLRMIRDGINPLEKSFEELEAYFDTLPEEYQEETKSYSRFLYQLEKKQEITEEEKESYIGIYRLVRQIEKTDGAAIGALVNTQAELHFSNLLSAVRSGKYKSMDVKVSDDFGQVVERVRKGESISEQISKAFVQDAKAVVTEIVTDEQAQEAYDRQQLEEYRNVVQTAEKEVTALLKRGELPAGGDNLMAAEALLEETGDFFSGTGKKSGKPEKDRKKEAAEALLEGMDNKEEFQENYLELVKETREALEENPLGEAASTMEVKELQLIHKQLGILIPIARREEYFIPMYIGEEPARVHLTFERGSEEEKGSVSVSVRGSGEEQLEARFYLEKGTLGGIFYSRGDGEVMNPEKIADNFKQKASEYWKIGNLEITEEASRTSLLKNPGNGQEPVENSELYRVAKVFLKSIEK